MNNEQMGGVPLEFLNHCKQECLAPDRIVKTEEGSILFSWIRPGKYAEIEFGDNKLSAWKCYETESNPIEIIDTEIDYLAPGIKYLLRTAFIEIEDFLV